MFCRFFRLVISHALDGDKQLSGLTKRHVRTCAGCDQFYKTCQWLADDLRREAAIVSHEGGCEVLSGRILAAVTCRRRETYKVGIKLWPIITAACVGLNLPKSWPRLIETPLASEFKNIMYDTESAVRFLIACVAVDIANTEVESVN